MRSALPRAASSMRSPARLRPAPASHAAGETVRRLSMLFHRDRFADQKHGRRARPAQSRSRLGDVCVPVGLGSPLHVSVVNVGKTAGAPAKKLVTVVFDSGSDVSVQAAGGHIDVGETSIGSSMPSLRAASCACLVSPRRIGCRANWPISDAARAGPRRGHGEFLHRAAAQRAQA